MMIFNNHSDPTNTSSPIICHKTKTLFVLGDAQQIDGSSAIKIDPEISRDSKSSRNTINSYDHGRDHVGQQKLKLN